MRSAARLGSHPIHPMLVAMPIGLFIGGYIFDLIGASSGNATLWGAGWYCMIAGLVFGFCAAVPGLIDLLGVVPPNSSGRNRGWLHGGLNATILIAFIWMAVYRGSAAAQPDALALLVQGCAVITLGFSGWLGGTLAYRNQIGIDRRYAGAGQLKTRSLDSWDRPVCNQSELAHGQVMLAEIGGERVVVGKCAEGMAAFSDHCTHRGGPLSDGALVGCTVQCPWHGSQFDIHTGRVVAGPAEEKIEVYETEIRAGEVYVKPKRTQRKKAA
jgi:uncharacterized membrane protein/nitrite reductase/ring-hydroxylating ferredoxin subunit